MKWFFEQLISGFAIGIGLCASLFVVSIAYERYGDYSFDTIINPVENEKASVTDEQKLKILVDKSTVREYEKYLTKENKKAFAVSESGAYGWSASKYSEEVTVKTALNNCEKHRDKWEASCKIVDINGEFIFPTE